MLVHQLTYILSNLRWEITAQKLTEILEDCALSISEIHDSFIATIFFHDIYSKQVGEWNVLGVELGISFVFRLGRFQL